jgi:hypothetical protein
LTDGHRAHMKHARHFAWNTTAAADGIHAIAAKAYGLDGIYLGNSKVAVKVK